MPAVVERVEGRQLMSTVIARPAPSPMPSMPTDPPVSVIGTGTIVTDSPVADGPAPDGGLVASAPTGPRGYVPTGKRVTSRITVTPAGLSLADGTSFQYAATAYDQYGVAILPAPAFTWAVATGGAGGTVSATGVFTAPATAVGTTSVTVSSGLVTTATPVKVTAAGAFTANADVGGPALAGHYSFDGTTYSVTGSGTDIWNAADQFNFASVPLAGNGVLQARVTAVGNTDAWAKAGVMFRETTAAGSRDVYLIETPTGVVQLLNRTAAGAAATTIGQATAASATAPMWLKLVRNGNSFVGLYGTDGTTWTQLGGAVSLGLNSTVSVGLVASSHTTTTLSTSTFDNVAMMAQPTTGVYRIAAKIQPTLSLDIEGFTNANGAYVSLYTATKTSNQQWLMEAQGDGTYKIYCFSGANSLQMLDLTNGSTANGNLVRTYTDNGNSAQRWVLVPTTAGYYRIVPKNGENTLQTLDIQNGNSAALGSRTDMYTYAGGGNQQFALLDPGTPALLVNAKKGLAGSLNEATATHASWGYDWGSNGSLSNGGEYDPMTWGYYGNANNGFGNWMANIKNTGAKYVMGFNEPDSTSQANLSVAGALEGWGLMQQAGLPLISPAGVHADSQWMKDFMAGAASKGYRVDAVAIHWYGGNDPAGFINYVNYIHTLYNKPVWVTEFCPADWSGNGGVSIAAATSFMNTVIPQLNSLSFVQRYSWFSATTGDAALGQGALYNGDGSLTALGTLYSRL